MAFSVQPVCLAIGGLDPSGGAGIIADVKAFRAMGCFAAAAISSITFQNTFGVFGAVDQSAETLRRQIKPVLDDLDVAAVKTGMLTTAELINETASLLNGSSVEILVVDPVIRSTSGSELIGEDALRSIIDLLFPLATLVTPNIPEAEKIVGMVISTEADVQKAGGLIRSMGAENVLIKGGHLPSASAEKVAADILFTANGPVTFTGEFFETGPTHGTGCALASAIAANLALGNDLVSSIGIAKKFVAEAIRTAGMLGAGAKPINI